MAFMTISSWWRFNGRDVDRGGLALAMVVAAQPERHELPRHHTASQILTAPHFRDALRELRIGRGGQKKHQQSS